MHLDPGEPVPFDELIHPRVEPEIVFVLGVDLTGPGVTAETALQAVATVHAGAEVIDSRYCDFVSTLPDVIADNASSSRFAVGGSGVSPVGLDLAGEACVLRVNGQIVDSATGAAVQGHPAAALALAANELGRRGVTIPAGSVVLTGGADRRGARRPGRQRARGVHHPRFCDPRRRRGALTPGRCHRARAPERAGSVEAPGASVQPQGSAAVLRRYLRNMHHLFAY